MILSTLTWFWIGYFSLGIFLLMDGLVFAWRTTDYHFILKIMGSIMSVAIWPLAFFIN